MEYLTKKKNNEIEKIYYNSKGIFVVLKSKEEIEIPTDLITDIIAEVEENFFTTYCSNKGQCVSFEEYHLKQLKECGDRQYYNS